ncbi:MAG: serine/threonine protein kinase, partial [Deltaproteobacteria bacterium]|nr:serine/threonine protein kinase [Deltaproteobacteria bacterium]
AHSHKQGLIHQGIKPTNIFILPNDQVKLIDFGLAFPSGAMDASLGETVQYMAPEQIEGGRPDERTDIYSLGITAFEMITGQRPFQDDDINKFLEMHATQEIPDPSSLRPDLPDALCRVVIQASQKSPDKRYQSVSEIASDLNPLRGN